MPAVPAFRLKVVMHATTSDYALRQARENGHLALAELLVRSGAVDRPGFESDHQ
jgi:hypothetical protein